MDSAGGGGRDGPAVRGRPPTTFTIGFPGHGDLLDEREAAAESARRDRHRPPRHRDGGDRLPGRARALRAAAGGAVRHPQRAGAAPALALRGRATSRSCSPARAPTSPTAATAATGPPRCCALRRTCPASWPRPRPRRAGRSARRRTPAHRPADRAHGRRRAAAAARWRSRDHELRSRARRGAGARQAEAERAGARLARCSATWTAATCSSGALPRHAAVPARRDPDLQRQDVDGQPASSCGCRSSTTS